MINDISNVNPRQASPEVQTTQAQQTKGKKPQTPKAQNDTVAISVEAQKLTAQKTQVMNAGEEMSETSAQRAAETRMGKR